MKCLKKYETIHSHEIKLPIFNFIWEKCINYDFIRVYHLSLIEPTDLNFSPICFQSLSPVSKVSVWPNFDFVNEICHIEKYKFLQPLKFICNKF